LQRLAGGNRDALTGAPGKLRSESLGLGIFDAEGMALVPRLIDGIFRPVVKRESSPGFFLGSNEPGRVLEGIVQFELSSLPHESGGQISNIASVFCCDRLSAQ
jgi:hypothetical protein